jgi:fused signal recognition particle receptor
MDSPASSPLGELLPVLLSIAGLIAAGGFAALVARRARAARQRQIDGADGPKPARPLRRSTAADLLDEPAPSGAAPGEAKAEPAPVPEPPAAPEPTSDDDLRDEGQVRPQPEEPTAPLSPKAAAKALAAFEEPPPPARARESAPPAESSPAPTAAPTLPVEKPTRPRVFGARGQGKDSSALKGGLARTRSGWVNRLGQLFAGKKEIDPALVDEIEKVLLTADIGMRTSQKLLEEIRASLSKKELKDPEAVWAFLRQRCRELLSVEAPPIDATQDRPFVLLIIGVNGSGKTTTIGKLAAKLKGDGLGVLLGAGDTFRAAATEQLEVWGKRVGAPVVRGREAADPSSVLFEAVKKAKTDGVDVVIADTAGRLQTKTELMQELQKVGRVIGRAHDGAPHETWLVIDATSGQNAISQAQIFTQAMKVTGIVLTKLDGTAKGGVILGIAEQLRLPVRFIGVGERVEDLREFDADEFVDALFEREQG